MIFVQPAGTVRHPGTGRVVPAHGLDAPPVAIAPYDDPRGHLVDWMTRPDNPYFARVLVNRMLAHFFGRGLVEPLDDQRVTNPPVNEPLLNCAGRRVYRGPVRRPPDRAVDRHEHDVSAQRHAQCR